MKKNTNFMGIYFAVYVSLLGCMSTHTWATTPETVDEYLPQLEQFAKLNHLTLHETKRIMLLQASSDPVIAEILEQHKNNVAGLYVDNQPHYRFVVKLKGEGKDYNKMYTVENTTGKYLAEFKHEPLLLPVDFYYGALETREEGQQRAEQDAQRVHTFLNQKYPIMNSTFDEATGTVLIQIHSKKPQEDQAKFNLNNPFKDQKKPTKVVFSTVTFTPIGK